MLQSLSILSPALPFPALSSQLLKKNLIFQPRCWRQANKQTNNINQAAAALYSTRKGKMSNVYLPVCPRFKQVCKTRIVTKFRARITYKVDKTELLFDHLLLLHVVFDPDLLPLVLLATSSSSLLSSAVLNAPWPACEMCACVRACVSLFVSGFVSHRLCCS
jgi:hypothetical protein